MLSDENLERYARQAIMPDIGEEGQERLLESRMLVVGAGGLGSPAIFYLAAAGVGNLTVMDGESVDLTNLNRQILHTTASIGTPKVEQAAAAARALNPAIEITPRRERLEDENVDRLLETHDLVIDCSDNVETRYRLGDAEFTVGRGMRIAQIVLAPVTRADPKLVEELDDTARGSGGFGSTGL